MLSKSGEEVRAKPLKDASKPHDHRRAEVLEALTELYLRLNGYFCIRNYLQHRVEGFGLETESDLLAVRMPYQEEVLEDGRQQQNDSSLILPTDSGVIDCLIAEVKEPSVEFNKALRSDRGEDRILAVLRMFGLFPHEAFDDGGFGKRIAAELCSEIRAEVWDEFPQSCSTDPAVSVRMVVFAPEDAKHGKKRRHISLEHVLGFTSWRMRLGEPCAPYRSLDVPSASPWRGCTRAIVAVLDGAWSSGDGQLPLEEFIGQTLTLASNG